MRRTGSNHLFNVLRNFPSLASCGEVFNKDRVAGVQSLLPQIREITGLKCQAEGDPLLWAYAHGNPGAFIEILAEAAARQQKQAYCFKIFEDQLDRHTIEDQVLRRPRTHLILLVRNALAAYVSLQKATMTQKWMTSDTTNVTVTLHAAEFAAWLAQQQDWYRHWVEWAKVRGKEPIVLSYENDIDQPLRVLLWRFAAAVRGFDVHLRPPLFIRNSGLDRQDRHASVRSRIANWPEFISDLKHLGLDEDVPVCVV